MKLRTKARELSLQAIYSCDFFNDWDPERINTSLEFLNPRETTLPYAKMLCEGIRENLSELDSVITRSSTNWSINRMNRIDRCLLRIAIFEILKLEDVPINVAINEAIELAKIYGAKDSSVFINGVLDCAACLAKESILFRKNEDSKDKSSDKEQKAKGKTDSEQLVA